ncbi:MAG: hypothetical protein ISR65_14940 [Bacteriovoracaceae bacterium]|nr:hypothetical protein [Bacteriovoracaceae bacterium]
MIAKNVVTYLYILVLLFPKLILADNDLLCIEDLTAFGVFNARFTLRSKIEHLEELLSSQDPSVSLQSKFFRLNSAPIELLNYNRQILFINDNKLLFVERIIDGAENEGIYTFVDHGVAYLIKVFPKDTSNPHELLLNAYYAELIGGASVHGFGQLLDGRFYIQQSHLFAKEKTITLKNLFRKFQKGEVLEFTYQYIDKIAMKFGKIVVRAFEEKITLNDPDVIFSLDSPNLAWIDSDKWGRSDPFESVVYSLTERVLQALGVIGSKLYYPFLAGILDAVKVSNKLTNEEKTIIHTILFSMF